jgi:processive 1,2-diacylglycerol beta-glucosyltransferase
VLAICGHNKKLYDRLMKKNKRSVKVYGFVNNMDELMAVSEAMITKPGGLSISEALVTGLPLIFFNAIPGQEENNVKVLATYQVGVSGCSVPDMAGVLKEFQESTDSYREARSHAQRLGKPNAAKDILALIT